MNPEPQPWPRVTTYTYSYDNGQSGSDLIGEENGDSEENGERKTGTERNGMKIPEDSVAWHGMAWQSGSRSGSNGEMPRRLRIQYPGAIYHVMARGNGRQDIVRDDADRDRLQQELGRAAERCSWWVYAFVILSNHLHVVLKTPQTNLARGMQGFLSAYANAWARRHRFSGHVFQGRYRTELVEDETYLGTVTRYVHLNPVRARLVEHPAGWRWSSYPGYAHRGRRLEWVAYDELLAS
jgi:REP element-mobilizing transposase RayT